MMKNVKNIRLQIDGMSQLVKRLKTMHKDCESGFSYDVNKSFDSLILAKGWLGKLLFELGDTSPYKSGYKTKDDIEPTADVNKTEIVFDYDLNEIERVDWLRTEIEKLIQILIVTGHSLPQGTRELAIARTNAYNHLCEAKMWLGFELQRIKEEK